VVSTIDNGNCAHPRVVELAGDRISGEKACLHTAHVEVRYGIVLAIDDRHEGIAGAAGAFIGGDINLVLGGVESQAFEEVPGDRDIVPKFCVVSAVDDAHTSTDIVIGRIDIEDVNPVGRGIDDDRHGSRAGGDVFGVVSAVNNSDVAARLIDDIDLVGNRIDRHNTGARANRDSRANTIGCAINHGHRAVGADVSDIADVDLVGYGIYGDGVGNTASQDRVDHSVVGAIDDADGVSEIIDDVNLIAHRIHRHGDGKITHWDGGGDSVSSAVHYRNAV